MGAKNTPGTRFEGLRVKKPKEGCKTCSSRFLDEQKPPLGPRDETQIRSNVAAGIVGLAMRAALKEAAAALVRPLQQLAHAVDVMQSAKLLDASAAPRRAQV